MRLLDKLKRLAARKSHEKSPPESQMPRPKPARSSDVPESRKSRDRSVKEPVGVIDRIIIPRKKRPRKKRSPQITLQNLPTELLTEITTLLAPIDRASLAFTSSWLHKLFSNTTKLNGYDRWKFLSRLEQSYMWPSEILCEICQKFHEPRKSRQTFTEKEGRRACIGNGAAHLQRLSISPYLSSEIHFDVMAAISRSYRSNPDALIPGEASVQFVSPHLNDDDELVIRLQQTVHFSRQKHVLLKSQRILFPGRNTGREPSKVIEGIETLRRAFKDSYEIGSICGHVRWTDIYPFITHPDEEFKWPQGQWSFRHSGLQEFDLPGEQLQECLWTHKGNCWLTCQARARLDSTLEGRMWTCGGCSTDYAVNIIRSETSCANYIVMTSWKDLGTCIIRHDPLWKEHMISGPHAGHRREEYGMVAGQIEKLTRGTRKRVHYFPQISTRRLREMFIDEGGCGEPKLTGQVVVDSHADGISLYGNGYAPNVIPPENRGHELHASRSSTDLDPNEFDNSTVTVDQSSELDRRAAKDFYLRVMPLGASITQGYKSSDGNGYRKWLRAQLRFRGWKVNMVGSERDGTMADSDNEGHPGWTIESVHGAWTKSKWMKSNLVLVNAGLNDCNSGGDPSKAGERTKSLVDDIFDSVPGVTVVLSTLLLNKDSSRNPCSDNISKEIRKVAAGYKGARIALADVRSVMSMDDIGPDKDHPTDDGYKMFAGVWWDAISKIEGQI
ncbi:hypothetical protein FAGAP_5700 [Fusarium agapanthi]|uniref:F-box domain-containing protein n=1 Tax=Fusarium agapanthi TaxID=1803897 RepID=A0A9P5BB07_9HYPO|nr:hypothetical protein FAGAP_5700 [Fusarium agapanthi]